MKWGALRIMSGAFTRVTDAKPQIAGSLSPMYEVGGATDNVWRVQPSHGRKTLIFKFAITNGRNEAPYVCVHIDDHPVVIKLVE